MKNQLLLLLLLIGNSFTHPSYCQNSKVDSLKSILLYSKDTLIRTNTYLDLFRYLQRREKLEAESYLQKAQKNRNRIPDSVLSKLVIYEMESLMMNSDYSGVLQKVPDLEKLSNVLKKKQLFDKNTLIGIANFYLGNYDESLKYQLEAKRIVDSDSTLKNSVPRVLNNIGLIYMEIQDWINSEKYMLKSYNESKELNLVRGQAYTLGNLGIIYKRLNRKKEAQEVYEKAAEIFSRIGDTTSLARNRLNLGSYYFENGEYKKAIRTLSQSLELARFNKSKLVEGNVQLILGKTHLKLGDALTASGYLKNALKIAEETGSLKVKSETNKELSSFYETIGDYKKALSLLKLFKGQNDSLVGENHLNAISELEIKYETQKKENELLKLNKEKQENDLVIAKQRRRVQQLSFGLGGLVLLGILGFLLFKQRLQNKKQEELLLAISETQTEERKRIAQDLHDSIGGSLALTKSKFETVKNNLKPPSDQMDMALATLEQTTKQVRQISHNLMPGELVRFGLVAAINTLLENINEEEINAQFHSNLNDDRMEPLKEIQLYRIVQEAIQNVLKHAKAKSLTLQLNKHKDYFSLMIEDDGEGMAGASSEGMGLKNIRQRVQLLKGAFTVDTTPKQGTTLNIQIPV